MIWGRWGWLRTTEDAAQTGLLEPLCEEDRLFLLPPPPGRGRAGGSLCSWSLQPSSFCQALGLGLLQPHLELGLGVLLSPGPLGKEVCDRGGSTRVAEGPSQPFRP